LVFEGHPTETARPAPSQFGFPGASTAIDIVVAEFLNRLRRNADQFPGSGRGVLKSRFVGPALVMLEGMPLGALQQFHTVLTARAAASSFLPDVLSLTRKRKVLSLASSGIAML
jgi:hypothetical protein